MVIKIAKKLGFDGFRSLRAALAEYQAIAEKNLGRTMSVLRAQRAPW
jgi:DNA-binding MurR/RpiR family transcriptional regulator